MDRVDCIKLTCVLPLKYTVIVNEDGPETLAPYILYINRCVGVIATATGWTVVCVIAISTLLILGDVVDRCNIWFEPSASHVHVSRIIAATSFAAPVTAKNCRKFIPMGSDSTFGTPASVMNDVINTGVVPDKGLLTSVVSGFVEGTLSAVPIIMD